MKDYFSYAGQFQSSLANFVAVENFTQLKNFYSDCFEFIGRTSHLIFRLQNFNERGSQNSVPSGSPKDITSAATFAAVDHGKKLDIINLSSELEPKLLYLSFDNKLRNGINHYKASINKENQIISYYPITKKPAVEYQIAYIDFLDKTIDIFNSVLKIGQLIKIVEVYKFAVKNHSKI